MAHSNSGRTSKLRAILRENGWGALLVSHPPNVLYLTGFSGSAGMLVVSSNSTTLFTDSRYTAQARQQARGCRVQIVSGSLLDAVSSHLQAHRGMRVAFESTRLTVAQKAALTRRTGHKAVRSWIPATNTVESLRGAKDASEVLAMKAAARLGCQVLKDILPLIRPGLREVELAAEIEYRMRRRGAAGLAFDTIVASGPRSALPHARPTTRKLRKNELVVLDLGVILGDYCSDLTRTVYLGKPSRRMAQWHRAVQEAHDAAAATLKPGVTGGQVDQAARDVLGKYGLAGLFTHSCGHGLGLEVHEEPRLARNSETLLQAGNVVTIEPGVYKEGTGGIRIEDDYVITSRGAERLTRTCANLFQL